MAVMHLDERFNQQEIPVSKGDVFELKLSEAPTTGYKWEFAEMDNEALELMEDDYQLHSGAGVGGGGVRIFKFRVLKKNSGRLKLENKQPWSGDVDRTFEVSFS